MQQRASSLVFSLLKTSTIIFGVFFSLCAYAESGVGNIYTPIALDKILPTESQKHITKLETIGSLDDVLIDIPAEKTDLDSGVCPKPKKREKKDTTESIPLQYMNLESGVDTDFVPADLVDISQYVETTKNRVVCMTGVAADALIEMADDMADLDMKLVAVSGYRSSANQRQLYKRYSKLNENSIYPRVAPPGYSEHQLGTAVDIAGEFSSGSKFAQTIEGKWVGEHAHEYGFILSYPSGGEDKTGYMYEPWHLRYVGVDNAMMLRAGSYTLAFKTPYYERSFLSSFLDSLKKNIAALTKMKNIAVDEQIGG